MATPKKRTGKASQNSRRANWKGTIPATTTCPNCKEIIPTHTVCPKCGYYKNGIVSNKLKAKQEVKAEAVKANETVEETKVETVEEIKEEKKETVKKPRKPRAKKTDKETEKKPAKKTTKKADKE